MPNEARGKTALWGKILAGVVLCVFLPLAVWFLLSFQGARLIPW